MLALGDGRWALGQRTGQDHAGFGRWAMGCGLRASTRVRLHSPEVDRPEA